MTPPLEPTPKTIVVKREGVETELVSGTGDGGATMVVAVPWWQIILIRGGRVFAQTFMGFFTLSATGLVKMTTDSGDVMGNIKAAGIGAIASALFTIGQNIVELLTKLDQKNPTWRG